MRAVAKYGYPIGTRLMGGDEMLFINFAYEEDPPLGIPLAASDEPDRYCIQLYHQTATQVDLSGKRVLEVSCGHGGGASYLMRTLQPVAYTGLDLNPAGIAFCRKRHQLPGLDFVQGDAEDLPFDDESFDAVINVEASHHYPRLPRFLNEVARVLRPGGDFLYTDFRVPHLVDAWEAALAEAPLRLVSKRVIDEEVKRGMEKRSPRIEAVISRRLPGPLQRFARDQAGIPGGKLYDWVQAGVFSYRIYHFVKD
ncbi:phthiotriol/phenolphthiotriol dimycocerosates methyltransferase [Mycobacterium riyadhense]|uniref:SAM-dependent methyltransferase n=1 Tax=Mycobacterium riyadhense TaxID=486698 RepID=A0A1X2BXD7_9MYCO|nr:class I SAM-dependent methyltransferase [Mycobacterium riyadhense]MCV7145075.1 class I SAM-dependent methyltransferase [Mycobacterium riyadhense]ORW67789.1 SAM-dependent methyltransferase [Mycobacterium riyadhense]VTO97256.1 Phthiotriol/phenolphthiotriol dimycocerosates methyltransferase [Mycobacterium riyadhense]